MVIREALSLYNCINNTDVSHQSSYPMTAYNRNPHPVVCGDVAPYEPPKHMKWLRGKPVQATKIT